MDWQASWQAAGFSAYPEVVQKALLWLLEQVGVLALHHL